MVKLFVYGLLKPGNSLFKVVEDECVNYREMILNGYKLYSDGQLTFISPKSGHEVKGYLLTLGTSEYKLFSKLDPIEGFKGEGRLTNTYDRIKIHDVWVYVAGKLYREKYCND